MLIEDDEPRAKLERELDRVLGRLRGLSLERLQRPDASGASPAARTNECSQHLADLAAEASGRDRRPLPVLAPHGAADQLAVVAHDVLAEGDERTIADAAATLAALRRAL
ncbi:MAG TPA: hypothetical protein VFL94_07825 [Actinomycetales bacterium]|nr:hypothetical protein [Actinomycetales bacterium]